MAQVKEEPLLLLGRSSTQAACWSFEASILSLSDFLVYFCRIPAQSEAGTAGHNIPPPLYLLQLSAWFLYGSYRRVDLKLSELWHVQIQPVYCSSSSFCWREQEERRRLRRSCDLRELLERP